MAVEKVFDIRLDLKRSVNNPPIQVVEGDNGNKMHVILTDDGVAVDLTGCRVVAVFSVSGGTSMQDSDAADGGIAIGGASNNEITISLFAGSYSAEGMTECELQVYSGENKDTLVTTAKFNFDSRRSIINDDTIISTDRYPILTTLIAEVTALSLRVGDMVKSVYDTDADGKVDAAVSADSADDSAKLGGNLPAHFATAAALSAEQTARAAVQTMTEAHASRHGAGGADVITPSAIGAASLNGGKVTADQASSATNEQTASYTLTLADAGKLVLMNVADANTLTIPLNSSVAFPAGTEIEIAQYGAGVTTIAAAEGVTILSMDSAVALAGQYACATIKQLAADTWLLAGAIA